MSEPINITGFQKFSYILNDGKQLTYSIPEGYRYVLGFSKNNSIAMCKSIENGVPVEPIINVYPDGEHKNGNE